MSTPVWKLISTVPKMFTSATRAGKWSLSWAERNCWWTIHQPQRTANDGEIEGDWVTGEGASYSPTYQRRGVNLNPITRKEKETSSIVGDYGPWNQLVKEDSQKESELYWLYFLKQFGIWSIISTFSNFPTILSKKKSWGSICLLLLLESFLIYSLHPPSSMSHLSTQLL